MELKIFPAGTKTLKKIQSTPNSNPLEKLIFAVGRNTDKELISKALEANNIDYKNIEVTLTKSLNIYFEDDLYLYLFIIKRDKIELFIATTEENNQKTLIDQEMEFDYTNSNDDLELLTKILANYNTYKAKVSDPEFLEYLEKEKTGNKVVLKRLKGQSINVGLTTILMILAAILGIVLTIIALKDPKNNIFNLVIYSILDLVFITGSIFYFKPGFFYIIKSKEFARDLENGEIKSFKGKPGEIKIYGLTSRKAKGFPIDLIHININGEKVHAVIPIPTNLATKKLRPQVEKMLGEKELDLKYYAKSKIIIYNESNIEELILQIQKRLKSS